MTPRFHEGQRVQRLSDIFDQNSRMLRGEVIKRYSDHVSRHGPYPELYVVRWDDGREERGFLPHGLDAEATTPAGCALRTAKE